MSATSVAENRLDFDPQTLPWVDRDDFESQLQERLAAGRLDENEASMLRDWRRDGYVVLPGKMDEELVSELLADYERYWHERPQVLRLLVQDLGETRFPDVPPREELVHHHYRVQDIQDASRAARHMMLHARVVRALQLIFDDTPVAMQSLFFEYGSEQRTHQDFPYVQAQELSHLVGCWMACDTVNDDNGPLFYYPGSHRLPKYDWGGRLVYKSEEDEVAKIDQFADHLEAEADSAGMERKIFHAERGDVFLWHGALAHGGSPVRDTTPTRRSLVVHYSTRTGYPRDRRAAHLEPRPFKRNGGMLYQLPKPTFRSRLKQRLRRLLN
ncbi:MAG: phytanoyl-CoA dioxygenase family protein [Thermoanaerobaculia bacterium]|nr:phytanoyl-CoA dioxygenase family protein [Thermoanaerobaculia bacterium]